MKFTTTSDIAAILGVAVPVFATVGAAIFGVTVAYQSGASSGANAGKNAAANMLEPHVNDLERQVDETILRPIEQAGDSVSGDASLRLGGANQSVDIPQSQVAPLL